MRLGILLTTPPLHPNHQTVVRLAHAALARDVRILLYLIDEGTGHIRHADIVGLTERGVKLFVCTYGMQRYGMPPCPQAVPCGLVVLSDLVKSCDRFMTFSG